MKYKNKYLLETLSGKISSGFNFDGFYYFPAFFLFPSILNGSEIDLDSNVWRLELTQAFTLSQYEHTSPTPFLKCPSESVKHK